MKSDYLCVMAGEYWPILIFTVGRSDLILPGFGTEQVLLTVEADYSVVFLAAGGRHNPGWPWIWKAYRSLSRKYRKNLKKLVSKIYRNCSAFPFEKLSGVVDSSRPLVGPYEVRYYSVKTVPHGCVF